MWKIRNSCLHRSLFFTVLLYIYYFMFFFIFFIRQYFSKKHNVKLLCWNYNYKLELSVISRFSFTNSKWDLQTKKGPWFINYLQVTSVEQWTNQWFIEMTKNGGHLGKKNILSPKIIFKTFLFIFLFIFFGGVNKVYCYLHNCRREITSR